MKFYVRDEWQKKKERKERRFGTFGRRLQGLKLPNTAYSISITLFTDELQGPWSINLFSWKLVSKGTLNVPEVGGWQFKVNGLSWDQDRRIFRGRRNEFALISHRPSYNITTERTTLENNKKQQQISPRKWCLQLGCQHFVSSVATADSKVGNKVRYQADLLWAQFDGNYRGLGWIFDESLTFDLDLLGAILSVVYICFSLALVVLEQLNKSANLTGVLWEQQ